ncbi:MAG: hypothetical protein NC310_06345 [Roseburia sp.]|nr:hypothetical protein [Anaeroplasma bactoclasticum]MCM1196669.1 hypothetical protein [Roseburia sp.]MCM1557496.1 hypothetical protein [Anaeroplasma bactoclasticum]
MTIILLFILYLLITNPTTVSKEVYEACQMWFTILLPIMYPSFVVIDFIEHMPLISKVSKFLFKPFKFLFHIHNEKSAFLILFSLLCGSPASTKLFKASYERKEISKREYHNLICAFSTLSLPYTLLLCKQFAIIVPLYYACLLILASIWMHIFNKKEKIDSKDSIEPISYLKFFFSSIQKNIQIVLQVLGILIIFRVLIKILLQGEAIFYPFFEILGGMQNTTHPLIAYMAMGFLGLSEHLQILSIAEDFPYYKLLFARSYFMILGCLAFF